MVRRRLPLTAILSSSLIAGGLFMLDLPKQDESQPAKLQAPATTVIAEVSTPTATVVPTVSVGTTANAAIQIVPSSQPHTQMPESYVRTLEVENGDTLMKLLLRAGINRGDAYTAIEALREEYDPRRIRPGQKIEVKFQPGLHDDMPHSFEEMRLNTGFNHSVYVAREVGGIYKAYEEVKELVTTLRRADGQIDSSLYVAASEAGLPASLLMEFIFAYSFDVDFQRDIQKGDSFEIMYEEVATEDGEHSKVGDILYASLTLGGQKMPIYRYEDKNGRIAYYDDNGQSAQKALMRTPINGARLSSGFGKRRHPILGYSKMHTGIDFAAPSGTPIFAAGDGVVDFAARNGGYGKFIRIRHNSEYQTAYAHMRAFKSGIYKGKRVRQGDIIGYVGTTGRSTGPHLHYEIIRNGRKTNPLKVRMPAGKKLDGKELDRFLAVKGKFEQEYAKLGPVNSIERLASAE